MKKQKKNLVEKYFDLGISLKLFDGVIEVFGGFLLFFVKPASIDKFVLFLTRRELIQDPSDFIANKLVHFTNTFTLSSERSGAIFLATHGAIKIILAVLLLSKKLWAYPVAIVAFSIFAVYQTYQYMLHPSFALLFLTALDIAIIVLTSFEYKNIRETRKI